MSTLTEQLQYAARSLRKSPGFTFSALLILALGIGANTAIFSVVNAVLLQPLPFPESGRVVMIFHVPPQQAFPGIPTFSASVGNYRDWRKQSDVFESMSAIGFQSFSLGGGNRPQAVLATKTEPDFFTVLRSKPVAGRVFHPDECEPGRDNVIVLSHAFAEAQFGSAAGAVGRSLVLDGKAHQVIGVMGPEFHLPSWFPMATQAFVPVAWTDEQRSVRGNHNHLVVARLRNGVTVEQARTQMNVISDRLARDYPEENTGWGATVIPLRESLVGDVEPALLALLGAVGFVLLIACANTANLVLARTLARRKELAIRAALGASTSQALRPVLVETVLLAVVGGAIGLLFAHWGQTLVIQALADQMPRSTEIRLDGSVLAFTFAVSVITGLAAGLIATARLMRLDLNESLKQGIGRSDSVSGGRRTRTALVVSEVALSLVLLVGAGLMIRSLWALRGTDPGFDPSGVVTMTVPQPKIVAGGRSRFYDEVLPQVRALPGVGSAGAIDVLPLQGGGSNQPIVIEGRPAEVFALQPNVDVRRITPGYIRSMRIPIKSGRDFADEDAAASRKAVILISEAFAQKFFPGENPIGKRLRISFTPEIVREIVGVVGDVKDRGLNVLRPVPMLYEPLPHDGDFEVSLVVRGDTDPTTLVSAITRIFGRIDPELPVRDILRLEQLVETSLAQFRFSMFLFAALAGLAFLLAAFGIYSVLSYTVRRRTREIGIRMALGAQARDVLRLIVIEGMKPAAVGLAIGIVTASALSSVVATLIYGVSPTDPYTFTAVSVLLAAVALAACAVPGWRATRVDPATTLRGD